MAVKLLNKIFGTRNDREIKRYMRLVHLINEQESFTSSLEEKDFPKKTQELKQKLLEGKTLDEILVDAFALAREAAKRTLGERHYDVQLISAIVLHEGKITEMKTGEGKTLSSVPAAYLNALTGKGVHIITVNDYLAERDAEWMRPVFSYLGLSVGVVLPKMSDSQRKEAYSQDITYITNNELGFDYLRDNMSWDLSQKSQRPLNYCIIDEIDSILIDEARTPLIISGMAEGDTKIYYNAASIISLLKECEKDPETGRYPDENPIGDFKIEEKGKRILLTEEGLGRIETLLQERKLIEGSLQSPSNLEYVHHVTQSLRAFYLYQVDKDYVLRNNKVEIVDEFTGRVLEGRRYSEGLHQAIEVKERVNVAKANKTLASITFQNFFRMYQKLSGMTGTADTEAKEFHKIYGLNVIVIPTNRPVARVDENDLIFVTEEYKFKAIAEEVKQVHEKGQPVLVGTASIDKSEKLSRLFSQKGIRHEVLNAKNHQREALIISEAGAKGAVTIATNMAGRGTDIKLGGSLEHRARLRVGTQGTPEEMSEALAKERPQWEKDYEEVKTLGGLYVIGSERHESRRIDNQLRGRSGRQGDPGKSQFYSSFEDDLLRLFGGDKLKNMTRRLRISEEEFFTGGIFSKTLENAQRRVEDRNFEIRKHLLEYDDVVSQQRRFIYEQRDEVLSDEHLIDRVKGLIDSFIDELSEEFIKVKDLSSSQKTKFKDSIARLFPFYPNLEEIFNEDSHSLSAIKEKLKEDGKNNLQEKEDLVSSENFNYFIRSEYLRAVDTLWQAHLEALDALREAVYLRAYAQKNPLTEYKNEGFTLFNDLIFNIRKTVLSRLLQVQIRLRSEMEKAEENNQKSLKMKKTHLDFNSFGKSSTPESKTINPSPQPILNSQKVGRNDLCPCGSGKKYKACHGLNK